jgi:uncharacterized membrane protein YeaQ/YmgE (transglycosylase-associated protein family)
MPSPNFTFAFIVATLISSVFHLIVGGDTRRLALLLLAGWVGFALGQFFAQTFGLEIYRIGDVRIVVASIGALIALVVALIFSTDSKARNRRRSR